MLYNTTNAVLYQDRAIQPGAMKDITPHIALSITAPTVTTVTVYIEESKGLMK